MSAGRLVTGQGLNTERWAGQPVAGAFDDGDDDGGETYEPE